MKQRKPTSTDVAKAAGVSQSTVSMILNGKRLPAFSDETIRRVLDAARRLDYNGVRGTPPGGDTIAVFCPVLSNPYYSGVVQAIEMAAHAQGFRTVIYTTYRSREIEMRHLQALGEVAGVIFTNIPLHSTMVEHLNTQVPVVVIGDRSDLIDVDTVEVNSYRSGVAVAEYMMDLGHRHFVFISTSLNSENKIRVQRMEGVRDGIANAPHRCTFLVKSRDVSSSADINDPDIEHKVGRELALECLEDQKLTAFICVNDMVAYGTLDALRQQGRKVPQEYSVVGFDNIFPSHMAAVSLTSIENHMFLKGRDAFEILLGRINQGGHQGLTRVEYQPRLVIRDSTGPARGREDGR